MCYKILVGFFFPIKNEGFLKDRFREIPNGAGETSVEPGGRWVNLPFPQD